MNKLQFKTLVLSFIFSCLSFYTFAQYKAPKLSVAAGFGFQQYNGDLGNGFYDFTRAKYGVASLTVEYAFHKSFDLKLMSTIGDYGYYPYQLHEEGFYHSHDHDHTHGVDRNVENLSSRLTSVFLALQYKFANGYLLPEHCRFIPSVYVGMGLNSITDRMGMDCVAEGLYGSINMGVNLRYRITPYLFAGASFSFGLFTSDGLDFWDRKANDMVMQNSVVIGFNL